MRNLVILLLVAGAGFAAETPQSLVAKLGSPSFNDREAAGAELLKLGPAVLPLLREAAAANPSAEVRSRAEVLVESLERVRDSERCLAVKKVRLSYQATPLSSVVADFKAKTGIPLVLVAGKVADANRPVTLAEGEYEPWVALDLILRAAGLREDHRVELPGSNKEAEAGRQYQYSRRRYYDEQVEVQPVYTPSTAPILLVDGPPDNLPAQRTGGVRVMALPPDFPANRIVLGTGRIVFHLDIAPLPASGWANVTGVRILSAEDDSGRPIFADLKVPVDPLANNYDRYGWGGGRRVVFGGGGMMLTEFETTTTSANSPFANPRLEGVALRTNDRSIRKLRHLRGIVQGEIHTLNAPIVTVPKLESAVGENFPGTMQSNLTILKYNKDSDGSVTVRYRHDCISPWLIQQMRGGMALNGIANDNNDINSKIKFYDAEGNELKTANMVSNSNNNDGMRQQVEIEMKFPKGSKPPVKLVLTGTKITPVELPFALTDVRLP